MGILDGLKGQRDRDGWRRFGTFWVSVLAVIVAGAGVLQTLGPPAAPAEDATPRESAPPNPALAPPASATGARKTEIALVRPSAVAPVAAGRDTPGPVADPDPALLEPLQEGAKENLPRIAFDRRTPMETYAAGFDHSSLRPRIGILLAGIGPNEAESDNAIRSLPGGVSLAVSPGSGAGLPRLLSTARAAGHEYLIALPLEPAGFPVNDPGPSTLLTGATPAVNTQNLHWALSRVDGYVGATGVIGTMRGERFAAMADQMDAVLSELGDRGLLYIDPREDRGPVSRTWGRHVDLVIDDPADRGVADRTMIDAKLEALEQQARDAGSALGLVMRPTPVAVARIAAWCSGLVNRGFALAPVSALAMPPADGPVKLSERQP